jgi:hypothetical protein
MVGHTYQPHIFNAIVRLVNQLMCKDVSMAFIGQVKSQCFNAIRNFVNELEMHFPYYELMNALSITNPQF